MQISITGPDKCGKTELSTIMAAHLRALGYLVTENSTTHQLHVEDRSLSLLRRIEQNTRYQVCPVAQAPCAAGAQ